MAAHNASGKRSCFSSPTDGVSAPGGEGDPSDCILFTECEANPNYDDCTQPPDCSDIRNCVVALDPTSSKGASGWMGTSFATPLVSGIAALVLQKAAEEEAQGTEGTQDRLTPSDVICAIKQGAVDLGDANLGYGRVNLPNSLDEIERIATIGCQIQPIPTLSQWGLIIMALLLLTVGTIFLEQPLVMVSMGGGTMQLARPSDRPLLLWPLFVQLLAVVLILFAAGFAIAIWGFGYTPTDADPYGSVISAIILAYMLHLRL